MDTEQRQLLRDLVDLVWNQATESTAVPSTKWADWMINQIFKEDNLGRVEQSKNICIQTGLPCGFPCYSGCPDYQK